MIGYRAPRPTSSGPCPGQGPITVTNLVPSPHPFRWDEDEVPVSGLTEHPQHPYRRDEVKP